MNKIAIFVFTVIGLAASMALVTLAIAGAGKNTEMQQTIHVNCLRNSADTITQDYFVSYAHTTGHGNAIVTMDFPIEGAGDVALIKQSVMQRLPQIGDLVVTNIQHLPIK